MIVIFLQYEFNTFVAQWHDCLIAKQVIAKTSLKHKNLIYVLGWFLNVFDLQYDS
jgi:hypothetical protein